MKKTISILFGSSLLMASASFACDYPKRVLIPNGNIATKEEMIEGQRGVKQYVADMEIYLTCIVEEERQARDALPELSPEVEQEREDLMNKKYNAAVDEMERVAAQFNAEVQAYKAKEDG
ncbi:MAG: hypothetical protein OEV41_04015 [Gammaproteobacteria bacterium]|nr:hypothetical protein [Gammaproteobacteria bacterium]MDH5344168.1 hypothetical protein [Gammaproteobacteria bacterium]